MLRLVNILRGLFNVYFHLRSRLMGVPLHKTGTLEEPCEVITCDSDFSTGYLEFERDVSGRIVEATKLPEKIMDGKLYPHQEKAMEMLKKLSPQTWL